MGSGDENGAAAILDSIALSRMCGQNPKALGSRMVQYVEDYFHVRSFSRINSVKIFFFPKFLQQSQIRLVITKQHEQYKNYREHFTETLALVQHTSIFFLKKAVYYFQVEPKMLSSVPAQTEF